MRGIEPRHSQSTKLDAQAITPIECIRPIRSSYAQHIIVSVEYYKSVENQMSKREKMRARQEPIDW